MNTNSYNKIKERADLFQVDELYIPFNMFSQYIYDGINAFNLVAEAKLYGKQPIFITPDKVSKIGGSIIPPNELVFHEADVKKYLPKVSQENVLKYRKDIYLLHLKDKIKLVEEKSDNSSTLKISGGYYFDVFEKAFLKNPIFIDNRQGLTSSQIDVLSHLTFEENKKFLDDSGISYYSSPEGIDKKSLITINNISEIINYKVVSIDDVCGVNLDLFSHSYFQKSDIDLIENRSMKLVSDKLHKVLSQTFSINEETYVAKNPLDHINQIIRAVCKAQVERLILSSSEPVLQLNKELFTELTTNRIFNSLGLYGYDKSFKYFMELLQKTSSISIFKENHILLQSNSYSVAASILKSFDYLGFKNLIKNATNLTTIKLDLINEIEKICTITFYEKLQFSSKGNLTRLDINKLNYQLTKNGKSDDFDVWLKNLFKKYNFQAKNYDNNELKDFLSNLSEPNKKTIKVNVVESFYEALSLEKRNKYESLDINFDIFDKEDFFALLSQNSIKSLIPFLYDKLEHNLVHRIESSITDDNKVTFKKDISNKLNELFNAIKETITPQELLDFHNRKNIERNR